MVTTRKSTNITMSWGAPRPRTPTAGLMRLQRVVAAPGTSARMPTVMSSEMPLPMPRAVICSPSHMSNMVPAVRKMTDVTRKLKWSAMTIWP